MRWKPKQLQAVTAVLAVTALLLSGLALRVQRINSVPAQWSPAPLRITAHRGASLNAPENTLAALRQAIAEGADCAEVDIQETQDGRIVLFHDENLQRITGKDRRLWECTYEELSSLDAGSWFSPQFKGEPIPLLEDALSLARGKIDLSIELKEYRESSLVQNTLRLIEQYGMAEQCTIVSWSLKTLEKVKEYFPEIRTGLACSKKEQIDPGWKAVDFFSIYTSSVDRKFVVRIHYAGKEVHAWCANTEDVIIRMLDCGVDNIITNDPVEVRRVAASR